ncbi:hypothetical protein [Microbacterium sp. SS28]|uniref:hypothetical protein n=1 Tax=Microbacterium sp. SS28 TaxID=2919948 RepID=UPI001FAACB30|nr:hypothetical protein [Microbacterium sp. SS28]
MRTNPAGGVVLVAVVAWISGILQLFSGAVLLVADGSPITGWTHIVVGLVTFPVCLALFRARTSARVIVTIVFVLEIVAGVAAFIELRGLAYTAVMSAILAVFGLVLLYTPAANASFRAATAARKAEQAAL